MAPEGSAQPALTSTDPEIDPIAAMCTGVVERRTEGTDAFIMMEGLRINVRGTVHQRDALLCLNPRDGYPTKLYLSERVPHGGKHAPNWNASLYYILGRKWHSWSWRDVPAKQPSASILADHLEAFT